MITITQSKYGNEVLRLSGTPHDVLAILKSSGLLDSSQMVQLAKDGEYLQSRTTTSWTYTVHAGGA